MKQFIILIYIWSHFYEKYDLVQSLWIYSYIQIVKLTKNIHKIVFYAMFICHFVYLNLNNCVLLALIWEFNIQRRTYINIKLKKTKGQNIT